MSRMLVLHIEDDVAFAELAARYLEGERDRLDVEHAETVEAALGFLADREVDCVLSDYQLPDGDGIELLRELRDRGRDVPFVLFTGKGSEEVAREAIATGADEYLQKEFGTDQYAVLANRIVTAVEKHRAERELERLRERYESATEVDARHDRAQDAVDGE